MPIGKQSDFMLQDAQYQLGKYEALGRTVRAFNQASNSAIRLVQRELLGEYEKEAFFQTIAGLVARRDVASTDDAGDLALTQAQEVGVKLERRIGPVTQTLNSFHKIGMDAPQMSLLVGRMVAEAKLVNFLDTGLLAAHGCLTRTSATVYDASALETPTMGHAHLIRGLAKLGDAAQRVACWVMHSKAYFDLMGQTLADNVAGIAGLTIRAGTTETLGLPVIVTDSPALVVAGTPTTYHTLGLVRDSLVITESEDETVTAELVTGKAQLLFRVQGEYAFNVRVKGHAFAGDANPVDADLGDTTKWNQVITDVKNGAGLAVITQ